MASRCPQVKPLIWIESVIEKHSHSRIEYMVKVSGWGSGRDTPWAGGHPQSSIRPWTWERQLQRGVWPCRGLDGLAASPSLPVPDPPGLLQAKSQFKRRSTANNVEIHIPVPNDADSPKFKTTVGSVKWVPENSEIVWSIKSFPVSPQCRPGVQVGNGWGPWCGPAFGSCCFPCRVLGSVDFVTEKLPCTPCCSFPAGDMGRGQGGSVIFTAVRLPAASARVLLVHLSALAFCGYGQGAEPAVCPSQVGRDWAGLQDPPQSRVCCRSVPVVLTSFWPQYDSPQRQQPSQAVSPSPLSHPLFKAVLRSWEQRFCL